MFDRLKDFFVEKQPTVETAYDKAERAGWQIEPSHSGGYTVHGQNHEIDAMNYLLDHKLSVDIGDQYRQQKWRLEPGEIDTSDEWCERKQEVREYRTETYHKEEYKPGWKRLFGR